jgi:hypothetical protein
MRFPPGHWTSTTFGDTGKHRFLRELHKRLRPKGYLEIGVQYGHSLKLAEVDTPAVVGVDPDPQVGAPLADMVLRMTSDQYFETYTAMPWVDLAYIDGMHLVENVLRDFIGVEERATPGAVVVIDDVLPYAVEIAGREPLPGDWTGDVWKIWPILRKWRPDLHITMVDVAPTGAMVIQGLDPVNGPAWLRTFYDQITEIWAKEADTGEFVAGVIVPRVSALDPIEALKEIEVYQLKGN